MITGLKVKGQVYEELFELLPQAVVLLDSGLRILLANRAAATLFQMAQELLKGAPIASLVHHQDFAKLVLEVGEDRVKTLEIHPAAEQESRPARILRITVVRMDGMLVPNPAADPPGESRLLVLEDITEKVMLEEQLMQAEKLAGMGQLAAGIAHELGNPLSSMNWNLQYVREKLVGNGHPGLIEPLDSTLYHLDQMHHLLRTLAGFISQRPPRYEAADLHGLIRRILAFISKEAERRGIELAVAFTPSLPRCSVDVRTINQVLLNIFKNAIEAMPNGGRLTVRTRLGTVVSGATEAALIEIEDSGPGIEESELRTVFRPLYSTKPGGTGLGLPFCRQIVEEHGGEIHLASRIGQGTTVTVALPLQQEFTDEA